MKSYRISLLLSLAVLYACQDKTTTEPEPAALCKPKSAISTNTVEIKLPDGKTATATNNSTTTSEFNADLLPTSQRIESKGVSPVSESESTSTITYTYDDKGVLTGRKETKLDKLKTGAGNQTQSFDYTETYTYNAAGKITQVTTKLSGIDLAGKMTNSQTSVKYEYNANGVLTKKYDVYADGSRMVLEYEGGKASKGYMLSKNGNPVAPELKFDATGYLISTKSGTSEVKNEYDTEGNLIKSETLKDGKQIAYTVFEYGEAVPKTKAEPLFKGFPVLLKTTGAATKYLTKTTIFELVAPATTAQKTTETTYTYKFDEQNRYPLEVSSQSLTGTTTTVNNKVTYVYGCL